MTDTELHPYQTNGSGGGNPKTIPTDDETKTLFVDSCARGGLTQKNGIKLAVRLLAKRVAGERVETADEKIERMLSES